MTANQRKTPLFRIIAIIALLGGVLTMGRSLMLLETALTQHKWPTAELHQLSQNSFSYRVGERDFLVDEKYLADLSSSTTTMVFYNPQQPDQIILQRPNFWWPLYLSMAGLIVFYAGVHLLREKDRNIESLSFE